MIRIMYDSTDAASIPKSAVMVAGYINGAFKWSADDWARFPNAAHVQINVTGDVADGGDILDVERFDATVLQIPDWVKQRDAVGGMHGIYCNRSSLLTVQRVLAAIPITTALWVADWTNAPHQVAGCVATQFENTPGYDLSAVYNDAWHPAPKAA